MTAMSPWKMAENRTSIDVQSSINQYLFQTACNTLSHSRYKIDIGYSLGWHQRYETCQGCNPLKFHESDIYTYDVK